MKKVSQWIVKFKYWIIGICLLLLIPACIGMYKTKINYDILVYLPEDIETMKGEKILTDDFNMGAFSISVIDNMSDKDILKLEEQIRKIDGVEKVATIDDVTGTTIPKEMLPSDIVDKVYKDNATMMLITFSESTSNEKTLDAVQKIRDITDERVKIGGMSAMVLDTMNLSNKEVTIYVLIAVIACIIILMISLDSYVIPFILLFNIGVAILYNMGTNIFLGDISYITKAISAVLQLGVTTDFSIFLYHRYMKAKKKAKNNDEAMVSAICETFISVLGSSLTTISGFLALCTMTLLLGKDIGLVMAKGVVFGVLCVLTLFPALLLVFDKWIVKTQHKNIMPEFKKSNEFVVKHYKAILILFIILWIPAYIGNQNVKVYYNLDRSLPNTLDFSLANQELKDKFNIVSPEVILVSSDLKNNQVNEMIDKIKSVGGIDMVLSFTKLSDLGIPETELPDDLVKMFKNDQYQMILVNSNYSIATDELNNQITEVNDIVKNYDDKAILAGEGPLMKDMINISNTDFMNVNTVSIVVIFVIMCFVLKSFILPIILVGTIEFAIFMNMAISYYTGATLPFIASIVIGTIQLGATIDYAILMTTNYLDARKRGLDKLAAITEAMNHSVSSIVVSGMCFFGATFGVGLVTDLEMIGSICTLISRGAIISMFVVIFILPTLLLVFDKLIIKTTKGFKEVKPMKKNLNKVVASALIIGMMLPNIVNAASKNETVYQRIDGEGTIVNTIVNEELTDISGNVLDESTLKDIMNINGEENYIADGSKLTWQNTNGNLYYQGTTDKQLPITMNITYQLDGKDITLKDLNGKSGHVTIDIKYTNLERHGNLYTPFVVTLGTVLDNSQSNVKINTGKVVSNGSKNMVVGIATPGLYESLNLDSLKDMNHLVLEYDTDDFSLPTIYNVVSCNLISNDDLKIFDKLDTLYSSVDELSSASSKLVDGSNKLATGLDTYNDKFSQYKNGINALDKGINTLDTKYSNINAGIKQVSNGIDQLSSLVNGISTLHDSVGQIEVGAKAALTNAQKLQQGMSTLNTAINGEMTDLVTSITTSTTISDTDKAMLLTKVGTLSQTLKNINMDNTVTSLNTLVGYLTQVDNGLTQIMNSTDYATLNQNITALNNGVKQIEVGSQEFSKGLDTLAKSSETIKGYTSSLATATDELNDGASELENGIKQFDTEGIQKLAKAVNGDVKSLESNLKELVNLGNNYDSFTGKNSKMDGETKFIMIIDNN